MRIFGVTLLTSLAAHDLPAVAIEGSPADVVRKRATTAAGAGCRGIVCSAQEIRTVRGAVGPDTVIVTPGIRPADAALSDQKRAATPAMAIADGADYLVVGRPISEAPDPARAAVAITDEIAGALPR
jgi:orotidine-5'-phosphate decarboxylase